MTKQLISFLMGLTFILSLSLLTFAQSSEHSFGLAPNVQNPKGETAYGEGANLPESLFGYGTDPLSTPANAFVQFPFPAGSPFTALSNGPDWLSGADFGPGGLIYGCGFGSGAAPFTLYSVDPSNGAFTVVSSSVNVTGTVTGMGYHESSNTMYLASSNGTVSYLYTIDVNTGNTTLIGTVTNSALLIAIAVNCNGEIYGVDIVNDVLLSIDPNTAAGTVIGNIGFNANYAQDADFDATTGVMYLAAYNSTASQGEFRSVDLTTGNTTLVVAWPGSEITGMALDGTCGPPCPVGAPSNPDPADGATNVSINLANASWTNGTGTTAVEVWFGTVGNLQQVYDGPVISSISIPGPLLYNTTYGWRVVDKNDTCGTSGPTWTFTTEQDPNLWCFVDNFENGDSLWTITNDGGTCVWTIYTPPYPNAYTIPNASGGVFAADADECGGGSTLLSTATITNPFDFSTFQTVWIEFDQDFNAFVSSDSCFVEVSTDGTNWTIVWQQVGVDLRNTHEFVDVSSLGALQPTFYVRLRSVQPGWHWWWAVDNFKVCATDIVPVELSSFVATVSNNNVTLNWTTATETNNQGFEIQRSNGGEFEVVGYVAGHGTTVEPQSYSFTDNNVGAGKYQYRLRQIDFDGKYEYSSVVEVEVIGPKEFSLAQNYPNPFNPTTAIDFNLAVDSKVTLKIFDILGQEVITLVNGNLSAGSHKVNFDASNLNSGVYLYRLDATGVDGKTFRAVKKMILNK